MRRVRVTKKTLYSEDRKRKGTKSHRRGDRTAERHGETKR
jgi:hypothetical protein